jgi:hypothetical protein
MRRHSPSDPSRTRLKIQAWLLVAPCNFWSAFMSGYGGNIVALLPNGVTFYSFSDGNEFP